MASSSNRPPSSLERGNVQRSRPSDQRASTGHSSLLHHSDDELFSARVSALITERRRLLRQSLTHRLQHLKAAILSKELTGDQSAEHLSLRPERHQNDAPTKTCSSLLPRPSAGSVPILHYTARAEIRQEACQEPTAFGQDSSGPSEENSSAEQRTIPTAPAPPSFVFHTSERKASDAVVEQTAKGVAVVMGGDRAQRQSSQLRDSDLAPMPYTQTIPKNTKGNTSIEPFSPSQPLTQPPTDDSHSSTGSKTESTTQHSHCYEAHQPSQSTEYPEIYYEKVALTPQSDPFATHIVKHEGEDQSTNLPLDTVGRSGSQQHRMGHSEMVKDPSDTSIISTTALPVVEKTFSFRSSKNQTRPAHHAPVTSKGSDSGVQTALEDGLISSVSPRLRPELQLLLRFTADIAQSINSGRWRVQDALASHQEGFLSQTNSSGSRIERRDIASVSRAPENLFYEVPQTSTSRSIIKDSLNGLYPLDRRLSPSELAQLIHSSSQLSGRQTHDSAFEIVGVPDVSTPTPSTTRVHRPSMLLSALFFDKEFMSLISNNFRLPVVPRDKSLLEAARISDQISCTLDQWHPHSSDSLHDLASDQQSPYLINLYIEPEHLDISSSSSTSSAWISDLQKYFAKVRTPLSANFQRRTYLNMSEYDERRAPTAVWHFDTANFSQQTQILTESSEALGHVAYGTATNTRRYSSHYSDQGVYSSPGNTTVALNFGFQTRTNYPFRKTYRHTHNRAEVSHECRPTSMAEAASRNALIRAEPFASALTSDQQSVFFNASDAGTILRVKEDLADDIQVHSIDKQGKIIVRKPSL
ncbi:unnamed protein product [Agarophyton chilense]